MSEVYRTLRGLKIYGPFIGSRVAVSGFYSINYKRKIRRENAKFAGRGRAPLGLAHVASRAALGVGSQSVSEQLTKSLLPLINK